VRTILGGLWQHRDFRNLWAGQTASMLGSNMTAVAMPIIASITLHASIFQMGLLSASAYLPYLFVSLFVGAWLDRRTKRPIIILADLLRAVILLIVPIAWWQGFLGMPLLIAVSLLIGMCSVVADIGSQSILPVVVGRGDLVEGNSKLEVSRSASNIGGNALGGALLQALGVGLSLVINSVLFIVSTVFTFLIRSPEPRPERTQRRLWGDIADGARFVVQHRTIRVLVLATLIANFFALAKEPIYLLFITRTLGLAPAYVGLVLASAGVGALIGALLAKRVSRAIPLGWLLVTTSAGIGVVNLLTPVATIVPTVFAVVLLVVTHVLDAALVIISNVNLRSYRSAVTPDNMQARMNASIRMIVVGIAPIGGIVGGIVGGVLGITPALIVTSIGVLAAALPIAFSHIRHVTAIPDEEEADAAGTDSSQPNEPDESRVGSHDS
jgi:MFS family permease